MFDLSSNLEQWFTGLSVFWSTLALATLILKLIWTNDDQFNWTPSLASRLFWHECFCYRYKLCYVTNFPVALVFLSFKSVIFFANRMKYVVGENKTSPMKRESGLMCGVNLVVLWQSLCNTSNTHSPTQMLHVTKVNEEGRGFSGNEILILIFFKLLRAV